MTSLLNDHNQVQRLVGLKDLTMEVTTRQVQAPMTTTITQKEETRSK